MLFKSRGKARAIAFVMMVSVLFLIVFDTNSHTYAKKVENDFRHYISVRDLFEFYGAKVIWEEGECRAIINLATFTIEIPANHQNVYINDESLRLNNRVEIISGKMLIAPSDAAKILRSVFPMNFENEDEVHKAKELWDRTVAVHLKDELWLDENIYDAGHYLMIPLHAAFLLDNVQWKQQFSDHFNYFMLNKSDISESRLNQLHYYYLLSRFLVLASESGDTHLIPEGMADHLYNRVIGLWYEEPAWQWGREPFKGIKERVEWKMAVKTPKLSYYRAIIDEEYFVFAIAADLYNYYKDKDERRKGNLEDILNIAYQVFTSEITYTDNGGWLMQTGVWAEHPDYAYAGNDNKAIDLKKQIVNDTAMDTSHSHRFPLWLTSLFEASSEGSAEQLHYQKLLTGLEKQFVSQVLVEPAGSFSGYRTTNFMDGRNGVYRWNYATQGLNNGYGPYELSGTLAIGWWTFLESSRINQVYAEMARQFPWPDEVIKLYNGPGTSRVRHPLISGANKYVSGYIELICALASKI